MSLPMSAQDLVQTSAAMTVFRPRAEACCQPEEVKTRAGEHGFLTEPATPQCLDVALTRRDEALRQTTEEIDDVRQSLGYRLLQSHRRRVRRLSSRRILDGASLTAPW